MRYLKYKPSTFFVNFSLSNLVRNSSLMRTNKVFGGGAGTGGGGGGGGGNISVSGRTDAARYHRIESFSFQIERTVDEESDLAELISALKAEIEKEVSRRGASVCGKGEADAAAFYFEYGDEGIEGRVEVASSITGDRCSLRAVLKESSTSRRLPTEDKKHAGRDAEGNYYVVAFAPDDRRGSTGAFYDWGRVMIKETTFRLRQKLTAGPSRLDSGSLIDSLSYAEVYVWVPLSPEMKERLKRVGEECHVPAEYDQYGRVYFLNEAALRMYRETGEEFEVLKVISAEEVSKIPGPALRGPYLPKEP